LRELGDASRWTEIALLNELRPPYIVNISADATAHVLVAGDSILLPAPQSKSNYETDPNKVFYRDVNLSNGRLSAIGGSLSLVSGVPNLTQSLVIRLKTVCRELMFHPQYGCWVSTLLGGVNDAVVTSVAAMYVKSALMEDDRVASVLSCTATASGDKISILATVLPISGRAVDISATIG
jgi:phage baseplate assembly protein W